MWDNITLSDVQAALGTGDREEFQALVTKAVLALEDEGGDAMQRLRERIRELEGRLETADATSTAYANKNQELRGVISSRDTRIAELTAMVSATQSEVAAGLLGENQRLKRTVDLQRTVIKAHEMRDGRLSMDEVRALTTPQPVPDAALPQVNTLS